MPTTKETKKKYYVRNFPLHKQIIGSNGRKTKQTYQSHDPIELTDAEAKRYQHLIETEDQLNSRTSKSSK